MGLFKKIKKGLRKVGKVVSKAAPLLSFVPGVGTAAAMALGAGGSLLSGGGIKGALKAAAGAGLGGLAGGLIKGTTTAGGLLGGLGKVAAGVGKYGSAIDLAGNLLGGLSAYDQGKNANAIEREANPFGAYRPMYGEQLAMNMADPNAFENDPAYQFIRDQGLEAVTRKMAAGGYTGSGNMAMELAKYGSGLAATYRGEEMDRLAQLAGAGIQPASRASATASRDSSFDQLSGILASLGYGGTREGEEALEAAVPQGQRIGGNKMARLPSYLVPA